jgi:3-hydroxyisobutyrate dehydrogenase-like beta-hydroxyacid dehydrogenase
MAGHLLAQGHTVSGFDPDPAARVAAQELGVTMHDTPAAIGAVSDITFVVVGFDDEVEAACTGPDGLFSTAPEGATIVINSTVRPGTVVRIGEAAAGRGLSVLDATLCRAEHAAVSGDLLVLAGGDRDVFDRVAPVMRAFASDVAFLGPLGAGQVGKMINNYLLWANVVADFEGLRMGQAFGLDLEAFRDALILSSGDNWALRTWHKGRPMPWAAKDMTILLETATASTDLDLPLATTVRDTIGSIRAVKEAWREANGLPRGGDEDSMLTWMTATPPTAATTS